MLAAKERIRASFTFTLWHIRRRKFSRIAMQIESDGYRVPRSCHASELRRRPADGVYITCGLWPDGVSLLRDRVAHERGPGQPEQACAAKPSGPSRSRTSNTPRQFGAAWIARADPVTDQGPTPAMLSRLQRLSNERWGGWRNAPTDRSNHRQLWRPVGDSNPCYRRERPASWASRRTGRKRHLSYKRGFA